MVRVGIVLCPTIPAARICGVTQVRVTSEPKVVGSIPIGGESRRSSVAEHWTVSGRLFPPQKYSGVVKVRVTSTNERPGENWEGCGLETRLFREGAEAQTNSRGPMVPTG
jgi:hypothetical protein